MAENTTKTYDKVFGSITLHYTDPQWGLRVMTEQQHETYADPPQGYDYLFCKDGADYDQLRYVFLELASQGKECILDMYLTDKSNEPLYTARVRSEKGGILEVEIDPIYSGWTRSGDRTWNEDHRRYAEAAVKLAYGGFLTAEMDCLGLEYEAAAEKPFIQYYSNHFPRTPDFAGVPFEKNGACMFFTELDEAPKPATVYLVPVNDPSCGTSWTTSLCSSDAPAVTDGIEFVREGDYPAEFYYSRTDLNGSTVVERDICKDREDLIQSLNWCGKCGYMPLQLWKFDSSAPMSGELLNLLNGVYNRRLNQLSIATAEMEGGRIYTIYQIKRNEEGLYLRFANSNYWKSQNIPIRLDKYDKIYTGVMSDKDDLESIYTKFNTDHPSDFTGHSLSVSDVVTIREQGRENAYFCDSIGFTEIPGFFDKEIQKSSLECKISDAEKSAGLQQGNWAPENPER